MRARRRFVPAVDGMALESRLPLDGDATDYGDATVAVGPLPEADDGGPMGGVLDPSPPPVDYDALLAAIDAAKEPMPVDATSAFD
jgi:hypothetical protein